MCGGKEVPKQCSVVARRVGSYVHALQVLKSQKPTTALASSQLGNLLWWQGGLRAEPSSCAWKPDREPSFYVRMAHKFLQIWQSCNLWSCRKSMSTGSKFGARTGLNSRKSILWEFGADFTQLSSIARLNCKAAMLEEDRIKQRIVPGAMVKDAGVCYNFLLLSSVKPTDMPSTGSFC